MSKVTYLLGAGASANTIPVVNNMVYRFEEIIHYLDRTHKDLSNNVMYAQGIMKTRYPEILKNQINILLNFIEDLKWLRAEASRHQTIDTLAKKYYLINSEDLFRLKRTLVTYFTLEQLINIGPTSDRVHGFVKKKELRYDSFFAALLNKKDKGELEINPNVKILTWNYDLQIELGLKNYISEGVHLIKERYRIYPNNRSLSQPSDISNSRDSFQAVKLNGNAIWAGPKEEKTGYNKSVFDLYNSEFDEEVLLGSILDEYKQLTVQEETLKQCLEYFNFSWESDDRFERKFPTYKIHQDVAVDIAKNTEILVIIGYSFPVFNRETDKRLIDSMEKIEKIYIQDPNADNIRSTLESGFELFSNYEMRGNTRGELPVEIQTGVDQFIIPFELS